jgi:hypothetical protein
MHIFTPDRSKEQKLLEEIEFWKEEHTSYKKKVRKLLLVIFFMLGLLSGFLIDYFLIY